MNQSLIDLIGRDKAFKMMEDAVRRATERRVCLGLPKPVLVNGVTFLEYPDGRTMKFDPSKGIEGILQGMTPEKHGQP